METRAASGCDYSAMPATQIEPALPKVPRLPCKLTLRRWKCHACHAKTFRGANPTQFVAKLPQTLWRSRRRHTYHANRACVAESTTPATQIDPEVLKAPRLSRKMPRGQSDPVCRQAAADIYEGPESTMPATQIDPEVLKVTSMKAPKVPRLPRKSHLRCWKCHACCVALLLSPSRLQCFPHCVVVVVVVVVVRKRRRKGRSEWWVRRGMRRNKNKNPTTQCGEK